MVPSGDPSVGTRTRRVPLPAARTLLIRPVRTYDAEGLIALYAGLNEDDIYRRFFSGHARAPSYFKVTLRTRCAI
jgi:hypothetical protein